MPGTRSNPQPSVIDPQATKTRTSGANPDLSVIELKGQLTHSVGFTYPDMGTMKLSTEDKPYEEPTKDSKHILILGAGVSGLMTAWMLLDKGYRVTIIADDWAWSRDFNKSRMTSQIAGALWEYPPGGCGLTEIESVGSGWANIDHYREWAAQSFDFYNQYDQVSNLFEKQGHSFGLQMTKLHQFFYEGLTPTGTDEESTKLQSLKGLDKQQHQQQDELVTLKQKLDTDQQQLDTDQHDLGEQRLRASNELNQQRQEALSELSKQQYQEALKNIDQQQQQLDNRRHLLDKQRHQLDKQQYRDFKLDIETYDQQEIKDKFPNINSNIDNQGFKSAYTHRTPIVNTDKAMGYLMALVTVKGANLETRRFKEKIQVLGAQLLEDHEADLIVNATGLGARELAGDEDVYPVRGAVMRVDNSRAGHFRHLNDSYLVPAQRNNKGHPTKTIFIVPRNDDVLYVGSIIQPNIEDKNLTPDSPEVQLMWDRAGDFMPTLLHAKMVPLYPFAQGLRPFTKKNAKVRADEEATFPLVHNYGHGGSGWTLGVGTARCAVYIVEKLLSAVAEEVKKAAKLAKLAKVAETAGDKEKSAKADKAAKAAETAKGVKIIKEATRINETIYV